MDPNTHTPHTPKKEVPTMKTAGESLTDKHKQNFARYWEAYVKDHPELPRTHAELKEVIECAWASSAALALLEMMMHAQDAKKQKECQHGTKSQVQGR